jgi:magnesium-transporting ATPase (P-type)
MEPILIGDLIQEYNDLSADGFRVLAVASRRTWTNAPLTPKPMNRN